MAEVAFMSNQDYDKIKETIWTVGELAARYPEYQKWYCVSFKSWFLGAIQGDLLFLLHLIQRCLISLFDIKWRLWILF